MNNDLYLGYNISIDLTPFMEEYDRWVRGRKGFKEYWLSNTIVKHSKQTYRVETYRYQGKYCYVFIDITPGTFNHKAPFAKKPSEIQEMVNQKKITVISYPSF